MTQDRAIIQGNHPAKNAEVAKAQLHLRQISEHNTLVEELLRESAVANDQLSNFAQDLEQIKEPAKPPPRILAKNPSIDQLNEYIEYIEKLKEQSKETADALDKFSKSLKENKSYNIADLTREAISLITEHEQAFQREQEAGDIYENAGNEFKRRQQERLEKLLGRPLVGDERTYFVPTYISEEINTYTKPFILGRIKNHKEIAAIKLRKKQANEIIRESPGYFFSSSYNNGKLRYQSENCIKEVNKIIMRPAYKLDQAIKTISKSEIKIPDQLVEDIQISFLQNYPTSLLNSLKALGVIKVDDHDQLLKQQITNKLIGKTEEHQDYDDHIKCARYASQMSLPEKCIERNQGQELKIREFCSWLIEQEAHQYCPQAKTIVNEMNNILNAMHEHYGVYTSGLLTFDYRTSRNYRSENTAFSGLTTGILNSDQAHMFFTPERLASFADITAQGVGNKLMSTTDYESLSKLIYFSLSRTDSLVHLPAVILSSLHFVSYGDTQLSLLPERESVANHRFRNIDFSLQNFFKALIEVHGESAVESKLSETPGATVIFNHIMENPDLIWNPENSVFREVQTAAQQMSIHFLSFLTDGSYYNQDISKELAVLKHSYLPLTKDTTRALADNLFKKDDDYWQSIAIKELLLHRASSECVLTSEDKRTIDLPCFDLLLHTGAELAKNPQERSDNRTELAQLDEKIVNNLFNQLCFGRPKATENRIIKLAVMSGHTPAEIGKAISFSRQINHHYWKSPDDAIFAAHIKGAKETIDLLKRQGFEFLPNEHLEALPYLVNNAKRLSPQLAELRNLSKTSIVYNPKNLQFDPYISFWSEGIIPVKAANVYQKFGEIPKRFCNALVYAHKNDKNANITAPWIPAFNPDKSEEFYRAFNDLTAAIDSNKEFSEFAQRNYDYIFSKIYDNPNCVKELVSAFEKFHNSIITGLKNTKADADYKSIAINSNELLLRLLMRGGDSLSQGNFENIASTPFTSCVIGKIKPELLPDENFVSLCSLIAGNSQILNNKYHIEYMSTYLDESTEQQHKLLEIVTSHVSEIKRSEAKSLVALMSIVNSLKTHDITGDLLNSLDEDSVYSVTDLLQIASLSAAKALEKDYPAELVTSLEPENLLQFIEKYVTFEHTLNHFNRSKNIPVLRAIGISELLKMSSLAHEKKKTVSDYIKDLEFTDDQLKRTEEYLQSVSENTAVAKLFPAEDDRKKVTEILNSSENPHHHLVSDITAEDRLLDVTRQFNIYFDEHLSETFKTIENLNNPAIAKELGQQGAALSRYIKNPSSDHKKELCLLFPELLKTTDRECQNIAKKEFQKVIAAQRSLKELKELRTLKGSLNEKSEELLSGMREIRNSIATSPVSELVEELGFDVHDSFQEKIFLGEMNLLKGKTKELIEIEGEQASPEARKLLSLIEDAEQVSAKINSYLGTVASSCSVIQKVLEEKASSFAELNEIASQNPEQFDLALAMHPLSQSLQKLSTESDIPPIDLFKRYYSSLTYTQDLNNIITSVTSGEELGQLEYYFETDFSKQLEATKGQCLDYRTSKNSIGNSPYLLSLQDSSRSLVVAKDENGILRFDAIVYLANIKLTEEAEPQASLVADIPYTPDGTAMNWSKVEGYLDFLVSKSQEMGIPLVIPAKTAAHYVQHIEDFVKERELSYQNQAEAQVDIIIGESGSTYLEIEGFRGYEEDTSVKTKIHIIN